MPDTALALDAGTTSVRAMVVDAGGTVRGEAQAPLSVRYPAPGHVEQDSEELWTASCGVIEQSLRAAKLAPADVASIGITSQRSCCIVWDRATGEALAPIVSWQDLRGAARATELQGEGYMVLPQTAASKLEAVLDGIEKGRARANAGALAWGNVDTFLAWRLSGGAAHITDASQGCATGYYDYMTGDWNASLLELQGLDRAFFPTMVDTAGELGTTCGGAFGAEVTIGAIVGDQQSAAIAQECVEPGLGKVTYGTSGTCNVCSGPSIMAAQGTYPLVLSRRGGETTYCIEGMVITAGAVFDWLQSIGVLERTADAEAVAASVTDTHGVHLLPAFQGLGSPYGMPERHAAIYGLTRGATQAHIVRAAMEGIAFRVREMVEQIYGDSELPRPGTLRVDGGATANATFMQIQADVLGTPVERMRPTEATAVGAAWLAGQACGIWLPGASNPLREVDRVFEPVWTSDERDARFAAWRKACGLRV